MMQVIMVARKIEGAGPTNRRYPNSKSITVTDRTNGGTGNNESTKNVNAASIPTCKPEMAKR